MVGRVTCHQKGFIKEEILDLLFLVREWHRWVSKKRRKEEPGILNRLLVRQRAMT